MRYFIWMITFTILLSACRNDYVPKPRGYFRIQFPEKQYIKYVGDCPFSFEYPAYASLENVNEGFNSNCWYNISVPAYKAKIHLTYKNVDGNLSHYIEDVRKITYKHIIKANDIEEQRIVRRQDKVYGIVYKISGNTASSLSFFLTDSSEHFLSGALYFSSVPNSDSLAPSIQFFQEDVVHLTESLTWK